MNITKRQHYIPQFILKNFCEENNKARYYNLEKNEFEMVDIKEIFMEYFMYDDVINNESCPQKIENDLSKYENEVSRLFNKKLLQQDNIVLSKEEDDKLKLFFAIMAFRNSDAKEQFSNYSKKSAEIMKEFQPDLNFTDFWKRNLGYLVNCRSIKEVIDHEKIDKPVKIFMMRDTMNYKGIYFHIFEKRGEENFVIGDCYPTVITGDNGVFIYSYIPLSSERILLMITNEVAFINRDVLDFDLKEIKKPITPYTIHVKKIYSDKVKMINETITKNCKKGYIKCL